MVDKLHGSCLCGAINYELDVTEEVWKKVCTCFASRFSFDVSAIKPYLINKQ